MKKKKLPREQYWRLIAEDPDFNITHYPDLFGRNKILKTKFDLDYIAEARK